MITTKLFRQHYAITSVVIFFFLVLGFFVSDYLMTAAMNRGQRQMNSQADVFYAHLIDDLHYPDRTKAIEHLIEINHGGIPFKFSLLSATGENISQHEPLPVDWDKIQKPAGDYEVTSIENVHHLGPPELFGHLVKLPGTPIQYLFVTPNFDLHFPGGPMGGPPPPPPHGFGPPDQDRPPFPGPGGLPGPGPGRPPFYLVMLTLGSLAVFILIGIGLSLYLIFRSIRQKISLADEVISELRKGNLKARIPITKMDELGLAMSRFNKMAEEIERLVEQLRHVERSRMTLLQDLTHDLRTPVASLKNLLATVEKKSLESDQALRAELLSISRKEVDYFERLVEDLLVLAQISEPRYHAHQESVSITALIDDESQSLTREGSLHDKSVQIIPSEEVTVSGDSHLLHRLFRNALHNALSFAKSRVTVSIQLLGSDSVRILIQDDGTGFSEATLKSFGERKISRVMTQNKDNRLSVGLGSVIMKTVTEIHSGKLSVRNMKDTSGKVIGAELEIILPLT